MTDPLPPFFIAPHRFDAPYRPNGDQSPAQPRLDRRHALVIEPGEQVLWAGSPRVSGYLLGPTDAHRHWALDRPVDLIVTDRRLAYVCTGWTPSVLGSHVDARRDSDPGLAGYRQPGITGYPQPGRRGRTGLATGPRPVSGEVRWQWPSRLELLGRADGTEELLLVCDTLTTIRQPALALSTPTAVSAPPTGTAPPTATAPPTSWGPGRSTPGVTTRDLARLVRRAVAGYRLSNPDVVELSTAERDALVLRAAPGLFVTEFGGTGRGVTLPGALPVEFSHRSDYYRRTRPRVAAVGRHRQADPLLESTLH